jgi:4-amino-4-deoxy-L-arabinose transferase-like glycosyltransferase
VLLADALLHGHLWIDPVRADRLADITPFAGRFYVSLPPMPAILMVPFVAVAGPAFNDALFTLVLGSLNVGLAYLLVRRLSAPGFLGPGSPLGRREAVAVAALLGLGTVHF